MRRFAKPVSRVNGSTGSNPVLSVQKIEPLETLIITVSSGFFDAKWFSGYLMH